MPTFSIGGLDEPEKNYGIQKIVDITTPSGYRIISVTPKSGEWVIQCSVIEYNQSQIILAVVNTYPDSRPEVNVSVVVAYAKI